MLGINKKNSYILIICDYKKLNLKAEKYLIDLILSMEKVERELCARQRYKS